MTISTGDRVAAMKEPNPIYLLLALVAPEPLAVTLSFLILLIWTDVRTRSIAHTAVHSCFDGCLRIGFNCGYTAKRKTCCAGLQALPETPFLEVGRSLTCGLTPAYSS